MSENVTAAGSNNKRPLGDVAPEVVAEGDENSSLTAITPAGSDVKRPRLVEPQNDESLPLVERLKAQVEYYLSDKNLRYDEFFHKELSANDNKLKASVVLTCARVKKLGATPQDLYDALTGTPDENNPLEFIGERDGAVESMEIKRKAPLPTLEKREHNNNDRRNRGGDDRKNTSFDPHAGGCLCQVLDVPEEVSWTLIKDAAMKLLRPLGCNSVHISAPNGSGVADLACWPFTNDRTVVDTELVQKGLTIEGGQVLKVVFVTDIQEAKAMVGRLPKNVKMVREKHVKRTQAERRKIPLEIGGVRFTNMDHLRSCLLQVQTQSKPDEPLSDKITKVLLEILKYHYHRDQKLKDFKNFTVGTLVMEKAGTKIETKCFFVQRQDDSKEDFSLNKCLQGLAKDVEKYRAPETNDVTTETETAPPAETTETETAEVETATAEVAETVEQQ